MNKLTSKIAVPIILVGIFAVAIFIALDYQRMDIGFYIVILIFSVYIFSFGFAAGQNITSPLKQLLDRATELSKGNLSSRVYLETKDEFAELAKVFNQIAEELQASQERGENVEKSVGIKVQARTQDLQEIINALEQKVKNRTIELERLIKQLQTLQTEVENLKQQNKPKK
jgi:nitrate/nitrite-specific signal transduction histidine kinase